MSNEQDWLHTQAGIAVQFDYQDRGKTATIDCTTILGQVPGTETWIVHVEGIATDSWGEYWWPVEEYVAISKKEDGTPVVDDATDEQIALFDEEEEQA